MRIFLVTSIIVSLFLTHASAETHLSGAVGNTTLDSAKSPYIIDKDIVVPAGQQLTIQPGTALLFSPYTGITVFGSLKVNGTQDRPVLFSSVKDTIFNKNKEDAPAPFDWNGITIDEQAGDIHLKCARISYSTYGIKCQYPGIVIEQSIFRHNGQFSFTLKETLQKVPENLPYSYGIASPGNSPTAATPELNPMTATPSVNSKPDIPVTPPSPSKPFPTRSVIRYGSLTIGVVGLATGAILFSKALDYAKQRDNAGSATNPNSEYTRLDDLSKSKERLSYLFLGLGAAGGIGFGLTFAF
jgi:hypothetical protein